MENDDHNRYGPLNVRIIELRYNYSEFAVVIDGQLMQCFAVKIDLNLRQRCLLPPPTQFKIFLEFVIKELKSLDNTLNLIVKD